MLARLPRLFQSGTGNAVGRGVGVVVGKGVRVGKGTSVAWGVNVGSGASVGAGTSWVTTIVAATGIGEVADVDCVITNAAITAANNTPDATTIPPTMRMVLVRIGRLLGVIKRWATAFRSQPSACS